jgi:hypothetical protein
VIAALGSVLRTLGHRPATASAPSAPTLALADAETGEGLTATVAGAAGLTHQLYLQSGSGAWSLAGERLGDGVIEATGLEAGVLYRGVAVSLLAGCYGLPSTLASATPTDGSAALEPFSFTRSAPTAPTLQSSFGRLLYRTCERIHGLELFKAVVPYLKPQAMHQAPTCVVAPDSDQEIEVSNTGVKVAYRFRLAFVVAGHDGSRLAMQCLAYRQAIKRSLRHDGAGRKVIFSDVVGHYDTNVVESFPGPQAELEGGALYYNAGLTLEYLVREPRTLA